MLEGNEENELMAFPIDVQESLDGSFWPGREFLVIARFVAE